MRAQVLQTPGAVLALPELLFLTVIRFYQAFVAENQNKGCHGQACLAMLRFLSGFYMPTTSGLLIY